MKWIVQFEKDLSDHDQEIIEKAISEGERLTATMFYPIRKVLRDNGYDFQVGELTIADDNGNAVIKTLINKEEGE